MSKRKVLIVDDEESICSFMKDMLIKKHCQVFTAANAEEAWQIFEKERPQACSIDLHLAKSGFDGVKLLKKIREVDANAYCVIFTRITDEAVMAELNAVGYEELFTKPPVAEELQELIELLAIGKRSEVGNG